MGPDNDRDIVGNSCVFEVGSTSGTCNEQYNITSRTATKKGRKSRKFGCWNINEFPNSSFTLKHVSNCQFCRAKRFEYELPRFCCDNGSVKLIHYGLPTELLNLYLRNSEESEHFRTYVRMYNNMFAFTSLRVKYDRDLAKRNRGIYTFRVQKKMYHFIDDLCHRVNRLKIYSCISTIQIMR
uniref:Uncharacterized protein n=1 Tax=Nicotiana tabacum TaxID=4097 RepID=A0A1S4C3T9_TOBAC|nr:PREDICTED: uncharacterized protein LOC107814837 [Nicotiana tabacum]